VSFALLEESLAAHLDSRLRLRLGSGARLWTTSVFSARVDVANHMSDGRFHILFLFESVLKLLGRNRLCLGLRFFLTNLRKFFELLLIRELDVFSSDLAGCFGLGWRLSNRCIIRRNFLMHLSILGMLQLLKGVTGLAGDLKAITGLRL
jgi:hypothetical protein